MPRFGLLAGSCLVLFIPAHAAGDDGREIAAEKCQPCHGIDGIALIPEAPNLAGQNRDYLIKQMLAFRSGERFDEKMTLSAALLSDEQIAAVAAWYASIRVIVEPMD